MDDLSGRHNDEIPQSPNKNFVSDSKGYALSGRIMLSAIIILFAVVIIMVCLHVYARWYILRARQRQIRRARRRTHLVFYIEPDGNNSNGLQVQSKGLDASVLKSLPILTFTDVESDSKVEALECAVCLSEFEEAEKCRLLPKCNHCFHVDCIDMWFHSHDTCPLCRAPVDSGDVEAPAVEYPPPEEVVVEMSELTPSQPAELTQAVGSSQGVVGPGLSTSSSSLSTRKGLDLAGVSAIEVPRRSHSFCFPGSSLDESGPSQSPGNGFKSPKSRILSLKRILSREKRSPLPSPSGLGSSCYESNIESGRVDTPSQCLTPRRYFVGKQNDEHATAKKGRCWNI